MLDPQLNIIKSLYSALTTPTLQLNGEPLGVYSHVQPNTKEYVLISQPTTVQGTGKLDCMEWECTVLLSIYTCFEQQDTVSEVPAYEVGDDIMQRLLLQRLALADGFKSSPISVSLAQNLTSYDGQVVYVTRLIRLSFSVYQ